MCVCVCVLSVFINSCNGKGVFRNRVIKPVLFINTKPIRFPQAAKSEINYVLYPKISNCAVCNSFPNTLSIFFFLTWRDAS